MQPPLSSDIVVAGTGPAGLIAALAFARQGFSVALAGPAVRADDLRTTALMTPAIAYLEELGVAAAIAAEAAPLAVMRIVDGTGRLFRSPTVTFRAAEIGEAHFGLNVPNAALNRVLDAAVRATPGIARHEALAERWTLGGDEAEAALSDGTAVSGRLAVAADGRASPARSAAGIETNAAPYRQAALVLSFGHARDHGGVSNEFHTPAGPFTQVPLPGDRSSLVWVCSPAEAEALAALDDQALSRRIEARMGSLLGKVTVEPGRQVYPLAAGLPTHFARNRVALVGEAAHLIPPIGAQGLNLGIRDVQELVDIADKNRTDPGSPDALATYDRRRRPDILARSGAVDLLNRSLLSDLLPAQLLRSAGLGLLGASAPLRAFFMREGLRSGSGFRGLVEDLRVKVRR